MIEIIENLPRWAKITGVTSVLGIVFLFAVLFFTAQQPGGNELIGTPSELNEIKQDTTEVLIDTGVDTSVSFSGEVISTFFDMGEGLAKDIDDPVVSGQIIFLSVFAGLMLSLAVVIMIMSPIIEVVKEINNSFSF